MRKPWNQNGEKSLEKTENYMLATMTSLRKMCPTFQFVNTRKYVNSKNITALHGSDFVYSSFGIKIPEIIWRNITILNSRVIPFFVSLFPPHLGLQNWILIDFFVDCVNEVYEELLGKFCLHFWRCFLSDWAWLISQRIQQEKYKCVCNSRVLQSKKNEDPINTFTQGLLILILINSQWYIGISKVQIYIMKNAKL